MNILGLMRIKDESRWIKRCVESMLPVCDQIVILDDHSTDGTPDICAAIPGVTVIDSPHSELNEVADKNLLLGHARGINPDWILMIDGDEMLAPGTADLILEAAKRPVTALSFQVLYLWDREDQIRMDGGYSRFWRPSMFRLTDHQFRSTNAAGGFHCGNVPIQQQLYAARLDGSALLHFGYLHREDRIRKYEFYNRIDDDNVLEDGYRHMVIGDIFPAESKFMHGGPLRLEALPCVATAQ